MKEIWSEEFHVLSSDCDPQGRLSVRGVFDICMDIAGRHAAHLGVGYRDMLSRDCFWVAVRTRVRLYARPSLDEDFIVTTWPGKPGLAKSDRFYRLTQGDRVIAEGRTEWGAQDIRSGSVRRMDSFGFPAELPFLEERVCGEPFTRFRDADISATEPVRIYTVDPMDIDMGHHMNNVAYIRMLLGTFSAEEQESMDVSEVEISYRRACMEGDALRIYRWRDSDAIRFEVRRSDGETAVHALLRLRA